MDLKQTRLLLLLQLQIDQMSSIKALLRPGRFDRRVMIDLPDMEAREKILTLHSKNKKIAKNVDMRKIASKSVGFSGADLENVLNEAAIFSVKNRKKTLLQKMI